MTAVTLNVPMAVHSVPSSCTGNTAPLMPLVTMMVKLNHECAETTPQTVSKGCCLNSTELKQMERGVRNNASLTMPLRQVTTYGQTLPSRVVRS